MKSEHETSIYLTHFDYQLLRLSEPCTAAQSFSPDADCMKSVIRRVDIDAAKRYYSKCLLLDGFSRLGQAGRWRITGL